VFEKKALPTCTYLLPYKVCHIRCKKLKDQLESTVHIFTLTSYRKEDVIQLMTISVTT